MQKYTNEQYIEIFEKLPEELKDAISSNETSKIISSIGQKHHLQIDQIGSLIEIVLDVLMGITTAKNFLEEVKRTISIESTEAISIVNDVDEEIFKPVRLTMQKTFREEAPNKLRTISTIEENDDEHLHLTKHDILREIENPSESIPNKITYKEEKPKISKTTEIEEYSEELLARLPSSADSVNGGQGNKMEIKKVDSLQGTGNSKEKVDSGEGIVASEKKENPTPTQKSISETKLSGVTSMKNSEQLTENREQEKEETSTTQIDPYREPVN